MQGMDRTHLTKFALLERAGWTATLVSRLLGEPDQRKKASGRTVPLALYAVARIEQAEAGSEFAQAQALIAKRKTAAAKAVATKTAKLMAAIEAMPIKVEQIGLAEALRQAIDSYNMRSRGESHLRRTRTIPRFLSASPSTSSATNSPNTMSLCGKLLAR